MLEGASVGDQSDAAPAKHAIDGLEDGILGDRPLLPSRRATDALPPVAATEPGEVVGVDACGVCESNICCD